MKFLHVSKLTVAMLTLVFALNLFIGTSSASAEPPDQLVIKQANLQVWPEYDDPRVLTIYNGTIINNSDKPFNGLVQFNIPKDVQIQMACEIINGDQHSCQLYKIEPKGDYQVISWRVSKPIQPGQEYPFWLEYYYNPLQGYPAKTMNFNFTPSHKMENLQLAFREPLNSTGFSIEPAPQTRNKDSEGFNNYVYSFTNLDAEKPQAFKVSYSRSDTKPSVQPQDQTPTQGSTGNSGSGTGNSGLPMGTIWSVLSVIVMGVVIYFSLNYYKSASTLRRINRIKEQHRTRTSGGRPNKTAGNLPDENARLKKMLNDGEIDEETYWQLIEPN